MILVMSSSGARASSGITSDSGVGISAIGKGILILNTTVSDGINSLEAQQAQALGFNVTVVDAPAWSNMSQADFAAYDGIVFGDPTCVVGPSRLALAVANVDVWPAAVTGNVVLVGTDPVFHTRYYPRTPAAAQLIGNAIRFASAQAGRTGLYLSLSCYYANVGPPPAPVPALSGFGNFTVEGGCGDQVQIVEPTSPVFEGLNATSLSNWQCSVHEVFDNWSADFRVLAMVPDLGGLPYILARGTGAAPPPPSCGGPTIEPPLGNFTLSGFGWSLTYFVSDNDGLVVHDVALGTRYMAVKMSMPYYYLQTSASPLTRGELKADSNDTTARSRMVGFEFGFSSAKMSLKATYAIDRISPGSDTCLLITQTYEFAKEKTNGGCEPTNSIPAPFKNPSLPCNPWRFQVNYTFIGSNGETLTSINLPLRMHFRDENRIGNNATAFQDSDNLLDVVGHFGIIKKRVDILREGTFKAIVGGKAGDLDNYHQTFRARVTEPTTVPVVGPGCPECIHFHWRWSALLGSDWGSGNPLIPTGSNQDVEFAVVRYHPGEDDPADFHSSVNGEPLRNQDMVFWYSATCHRDHDTVFPLTDHGAFFSTLTHYADLAVAGSASPNPVHVGSDLAYTFTVTNNGPSKASHVFLGDSWSSFMGTFVAGLSSDSCFAVDPSTSVVCDLGGLLSGQSKTVTVVLHMTIKGSITNMARVSAQEQDQNPDNNQITLITEIVSP